VQASSLLFSSLRRRQDACTTRAASSHTRSSSPCVGSARRAELTKPWAKPREFRLNSLMATEAGMSHKTQALEKCDIPCQTVPLERSSPETDGPSVLQVDWHAVSGVRVKELSGTKPRPSAWAEIDRVFSASECTNSRARASSRVLGPWSRMDWKANAIRGSH